MKVHVYRAVDGWRWQLKARNGRIIAESGEAYTNRSKCVDGWHRVETAAYRKVPVIYDDGS
jgi:uncharacterized protein